jgi:hypothetical protein
MNTKTVTSQQQTWTSEQFINLSHNLADAYTAGANQSNTNRNDDQWTTEKLINMSASFAHAYLGL